MSLRERILAYLSTVARSISPSTAAPTVNAWKQPNTNGAGPARRTLARLKRGVPPTLGIFRFAVGMHHVEQRISTLLLPDSRPRWFAVTGEYGEGKSFFRALACENALEAGYAVASFDVNRDEGALHQPQRHLSVLLNTLQSPLPALRDHQGILDVLRQWLITAPGDEFAATLRRLAAISPALKSVGDTSRVDWLVANALAAETSSAFATSPYLFTMLALMSAGDLVARSSYARFSAAYRLQLVLEWLKATGHRGLFLFIDEIDNVARQISRNGHPACFRTLAWYCSCPQLQSLRVIFAMTPEMQQRLDTNSRNYYGEELKSQQTVLPEECAVYNRWNREAGQTTPSVWESCVSLNAVQRVELFRRIAKVHCEAWDYTCVLPEHDLLNLARSSTFGTTRRWVRACAQILDVMAQYPSSSRRD